MTYWSLLRLQGPVPWLTEIHALPDDDLRDHEHGRDCWCKPTDQDCEDGIWMHNSVDGREPYETGVKLWN